MTKPIRAIDEARLESDLGYRFKYLAEFCGFGEDDIAVIHASAPLLAPVVPALVDAVYDHLFQFDATKRHFAVAQEGFEGEVPSADALTVDDEIIAFRKNHLGRYLRSLVTKPYDDALVRYLDNVGKIHTTKAGNPAVVIPLVQMNALLAFVSSAVISTIATFDLEPEVKLAATVAFNKLLWIQADLITRHYVS